MICILTERDPKDFHHKHLKVIELADLVLNVNYTQGKVEILKNRRPKEEIVESIVSNLTKEGCHTETHSTSYNSSHVFVEGQMFKGTLTGTFYKIRSIDFDGRSTNIHLQSQDSREMMIVPINTFKMKVESNELQEVK